MWRGRLRVDLDTPEQEYRILGKKGEGTFSEVLKCQHVKDGTYYACKKMKQHYDGIDQVNNLREIQAMRRLNPHANVIGLHEIIYDKKTGTVALICELMDMNIYEMIRGRRHYVPEPKVKNYMFQLLKSLDHMHRCGIFHRDVKPENILIKDEVLKLADFGSCRSVYSKPPYTEYISTRWYRAPECLLTDGYYSYRMDLWSVGCVFFEVMSLHPLFPGANEVDQIAKIHDVLGTPDASVLNKMKHRNRGINFDFPPKKGTGIEKLLPHASQQCIELIYKLCAYDPDERITAKQALRHPYFRDLREADKRAQEAQQMPKFDSSSIKAGTESTAGDVPIWKQNQIQKKRGSVSSDAAAEAGVSGIQQKRRKSRNIREKTKANNSPARYKPLKNPGVPQTVSLLKVQQLKTEKGRNSEEATPSDSQQEARPSLAAEVWKELARDPKRPVRRAVRFNRRSPHRRKESDKKTSVRISLSAGKLERPEVQPLSRRIPPRVLAFNQRRQRRLVEHHHPSLGLGGIVGHSNALPQLVPVNGTSMHGPTGFGAATKPVFTSTLPKVHLPHHHQTGTSALLPGILKTNMMQPKVFNKAKLKPTDPPTKTMYGHYQLPAINRHIYHN